MTKLNNTLQLVLALVLGVSALLITGCSSGGITDTDWVPGYNSQENGNRILRDFHYNLEEMFDDVDTDALMLRPSSSMTWWTVSQSN